MRQGVKEMQTAQTTLTGLSADWHEPSEMMRPEDRLHSQDMIFGEARFLVKQLGR